MSLVIDLQVETPLNEAEQESLSVILKALPRPPRLKPASGGCGGHGGGQ